MVWFGSVWFCFVWFGSVYFFFFLTFDASLDLSISCPESLSMRTISQLDLNSVGQGTTVR